MTEPRDMSQAKVPENGEPEVEAPRERPKKTRRRYLVVDKPYQLRELIFVLVISALMLFAGGGLGAYIAYDTLIEGSLAAALLNNWHYILAELVVLLCLLVPVMSLFYSHKVAGPVYRMRKEMRRVSQGERGFRVHLRQSDQLKSLADIFNQMLQAIEVREGTMSSRQARIRETLATVIEKLEDCEDVDQEALLLLKESEQSLE